MTPRNLTEYRRRRDFRRTPEPAGEDGAESGEPRFVIQKGVHWVTPKLVAEVGFTEWTRDDKLRHPRFVGLRTDKNPADVVKETPV